MALFKSRKIGMVFVLLISLIFVSAIVAAAVIRLSADANRGTTVGDYPVTVVIDGPGAEVAPWGDSAIIGESYFATLVIHSNDTYDANLLIEIDGPALEVGDVSIYLTIGNDSVPVDFSVVGGQLVGNVPISLNDGATSEFPVEVVFQKTGTFNVTFWVASA